IPAGAIQGQQAAVMDIFPTLLSVAGVENPASHTVDGRPLTTLLSGTRDAARPESFLMHYPHSPHRTAYWSSLREGDWKVIYHYFPTEVSGGSHYQLFNLKDDPFEQKDLASAQPAQVRSMMEKLI